MLRRLFALTVGAIVSTASESVPPATAMAAPGDLLWSTPIRGDGYGCPAVGSDGFTLYFGTHTNGAVLYKIDGHTGAVLDSAYVRGTVENGVALSHDERLYVPMIPSIQRAAGNPYPPAGGIACFSAEDLSELWFQQADGPGSDNSPILGHPQRPGRVYLGYVADPRAPRPFACLGRHFTAYDVNSGVVVFDYATEGWQASPGVITPSGRLFFGGEDLHEYCEGGVPPSGLLPGFAYALTGDDDGSELFEPFPTDGECGGGFAWHDGIVYFTSRDGLLRGRRETDGAIVFSFDLGARSWSGVTIGRHPVTGNPILYVATQAEDLGPPGGAESLYAIEVDGAPSGELLWVQELGGFAWGTAALDDLGNVYCTTSTGFLHALTWDGVPLWTRVLPGAGGEHPLGGIDGPTILDDGTIVSASNGGYLVAYEGSGNHLNDQVPWPKYKHDHRNTSNPLTPIRDSSSSVDNDSSESGISIPSFVDLKIAPVPAFERVRLSGRTVPGETLRIEICDPRGSKVCQRELRAANDGRWELDWELVDDTGASVPRGVYLARVRASGGVRTGKILRL